MADFKISERRRVENYRMRSSADYPGDLVERHERVINGHRYEFSRVQWGDGSVSVRSWIGGTTITTHDWERLS